MQSTLLIDAPQVLTAADGSSLLTPVSRAWLQRILDSQVPVLIFRGGEQAALIQQAFGDAAGLHLVPGDTLPGLGPMIALADTWG